MSIKYFCDYCKLEISIPKARMVLQLVNMEDEKKTQYHLHKGCWEKYIKDVVTGSSVPIKTECAELDTTTALIDKMASELKESDTMKKEEVSAPVNTDIIEQVSKKDKKSKKNLEEQVEHDEKIATADIDRDLFREWEITRSSRVTQYFTNKACSYIHRYLLLGSKPRAISMKMNIPYQSVILYIKLWNKQGLGKYEPIMAEDILEGYAIKYRSVIPKVKALMATCTWSNVDIASECAIPEEVVQVVWDELPYFVNFDKTE